MNSAPVFLLVEPSPIVASALGRWLENVFSNSQIFVASNGAEALQLATENFPSYILIELSLPDKAGIEILIQLRQALPASRIIATSWFQGRWLIDGARSAGADGFILKNKLRNELLPLWGFFQGKG
ncbi:MAG TPA: response regulator transcription factor [Anaerolineales bacterium]|nr:response regulator transcription factor [Anaerolineales bacterium]